MEAHSEVDVVVIGVGTCGEDLSLHVLDAPGTEPSQPTGSPWPLRSGTRSRAEATTPMPSSDSDSDEAGW